MPQSALLEGRSTGVSQIKLVAHSRLIGVGADQHPIRLRTGSWWVEFGLDSLPSHVSGQLRIGFISDRVNTQRDANPSLLPTLGWWQP